MRMQPMGEIAVERDRVGGQLFGLGFVGDMRSPPSLPQGLVSFASLARGPVLLALGLGLLARFPGCRLLDALGVYSGVQFGHLARLFHLGPDGAHCSRARLRHLGNLPVRLLRVLLEKSGGDLALFNSSQRRRVAVAATVGTTGRTDELAPLLAALDLSFLIHERALSAERRASS